MSHLIALALAFGLLVGPAQPGDAPRDALTVSGAAHAEIELLDWSIELFAATDMQLPALDVGFHDDESGCGGIHGNFKYRNGLARINICNPSRHIVVHELAHAWISHSVPDPDRQRFMSELGLDGWNDEDTRWVDRGTERAANMVGLVLTWEPGSLTDPGALQRLCAFETLTGRDLPPAIPAACG
jgi:hypothetical protein